MKWLALLFALGWSFAAVGATLHVGAGHRFGLPSQAIAAAHDGDTIAIDPGLYKDCAIVRQNRLTIRGTGPGVVLADVSCAGKGILVIDANDVTVAGLTLRGAVVPDGNGSGIRAEGGNLTVIGVRFVADQDGILTVNNPNAVLRVRDSLFLRDGTCVGGGGCAHGIYANHIAELDVENSRFRAIQAGHDIKSRALRTVVRHSTLIDGPDGTSSYQIQLPNGGDLLATHDVLEKGPKSGNRGTAIMIGDEGITQPTTSLVVRDSTLIDDTGHPTVFVHNFSAAPVVLTDDHFRGDTVYPIQIKNEPVEHQSLWRSILTPHRLAALAVVLVVGVVGATMVRRQVRRAGGRRFARRILAGAAILLVLLAIIGSGAAVLVLQRVAEPPRDWGPYLARRATNHNPLIVRATALVAAYLRWADRLPDRGKLRLPAAVGASATRDVAPPATGRLVPVDSMPALLGAINAAKPGDVIELAPGTYPLEGHGLYLATGGTRAAPITLRAARLGTAVIRSDVVEAIKVAAPYWHFENLVVEGVCGDDSGCEHAFHIVGAARHTVIRNSRLMNFNAQIKINTEQGQNPDDGRIIGDTLIDTHPRQTGNPVTPIDLDTASGWQVRDTLIADFVKTGGNQVSYGAFAKAAGGHNDFVRNVVLCRWHLHDNPGERIGLSFGGGGSPDSIRRDQGHTGLEQLHATMRDNLIAFCSDDGIYLNRVGGATVSHNTLIDTGGIDARFPDTSARIADNIVDGAIRVRSGARITTDGNRDTWLPLLFLGLHPVRSLFADPARLDLLWADRPEPVTTPDAHRDLCGARRPPQPLPGAFQNYAACLIPPVQTAAAAPPRAAR